MKPTRMQFTVRRMLVVVAASALLLWPGIVAMRWDGFRRRAEMHEEVVRTLSSEIIGIRARGGPEGEATMRQDAMLDENREADRYRRAMQCPWADPEPARKPR